MNDTFIDRTFSVISDILVDLLPTSKRNKTSFSYYRSGLGAQSEGRYVEAVRNYFESLQGDTDPFDRGYSFYNLGVIYVSNGKEEIALNLFQRSLQNNPFLYAAQYNVGCIYHNLGEKAIRNDNTIEGKLFFTKAQDAWIETSRFSSGKYPQIENFSSLQN